ncbi:tail fiber domain-containing protein [bacterium]|nr:tail fiber domain-containing protein [bacterium]
MDSISSDVLTFATNGNIGIGTTSPNAGLDISRSNTFGQLWLSNAVQNRKIVLYNTVTNDHQYFGFGINSGTLRYQIDTAVSTNAHIFYAGASSTSSNELMRIRGDGNVGIGTNSPNYKLEVNGDIAIPYGNAIRTTGVTNTKLMEVVYTGYDQTRIWLPGNGTGTDTVKMSLQNNGAIGINTTSPGRTLDVIGAATFGFTSASIAIGLNLTNYNVNYGSSAGIGIGQGNQWTRLYDYNINNFGNNFSIDMTCQNSTYASVLFANNWNGNRVMGINKQWPDYTLDIAGHLNVNGEVNRTIGNFGYLNSVGVGSWTGVTTPFSIYASNRIAATEFNAYSDQRIKTDIQDINDASALETIRAIEPKRYTYVDKVVRGDKPVWGQFQLGYFLT